MGSKFRGAILASSARRRWLRAERPRFSASLREYKLNLHKKANRRKSPGPLRRRFLILLASIRQSDWEIKKEKGVDWTPGVSPKAMRNFKI
jgi:hypothetical protein